MLSQPLWIYQRDSRETERTNCHWPKLLAWWFKGAPVPHQTQKKQQGLPYGPAEQPRGWGCALVFKDKTLQPILLARNPWWLRWPRKFIFQISKTFLIKQTGSLFCLFGVFLVCLFATPTACGSSQARNQTRATAVQQWREPLQWKCWILNPLCHNETPKQNHF